MLNNFVGIKEKSYCEIIVQKSKFYCFAYPVFSKNDVQKYLDELNKKYHDSTHICYAYVLNDNGVQEKYNDDGEPQGTAGYPICAVIKKKNLMNVLVCVVRYFGGIKLGANGLTRTYSSCTSRVLEESEIYKYELSRKLTIKFNSMEYFKYVRLLNSSVVKNRKEIFEEDICKVDIFINEKEVENFIVQLRLIDSNIQIEYTECYL